MTGFGEQESSKRGDQQGDVDNERVAYPDQEQVGSCRHQDAGDRPSNIGAREQTGNVNGGYNFRQVPRPG